MRLMSFCVLATIAVATLAGSRASANMFANPSFEDPITQDGPPFVGSWEGFQGGGATAGNDATMPRTGAMDVKLAINNTVNTFAGVFQDVPNLTPGTMWTFSGWDKTVSNPLNLGVEIRIEWRNSVSNTEISRTPNSTPVPTSDYAPFSLTAAVPAGADTARAVFAIQSFSTSPLGNGSVLIDDFSFQVPEPTTVVLLGLGGLGLAAVRRRLV